MVSLHKVGRYRSGRELTSVIRITSALGSAVLPAASDPVAIPTKTPRLLKELPDARAPWARIRRSSCSRQARSSSDSKNGHVRPAPPSSGFLTIPPGRPEAEPVFVEGVSPGFGPQQKLDLGGVKLPAVPGRFRQAPMTPPAPGNPITPAAPPADPVAAPPSPPARV